VPDGAFELGATGEGRAYRGCEIPPDLLYDVERDVWLRPDDAGYVTLGMTDPAQSRAGKVLHILFKKVGRRLEPGQSAATIETAKWAGPFPTPVAGTVVETNEATFAADILIANRDPYGAGWIVRIEPEAWPAAAEAGLVTGADAVARYEERIDRLGLTCLRCAD
jgi:glycine cleavage system H protein